MAYALEPLHCRQELIGDTIKLLKEEWPNCLAERLRLVETAQCTGLPCSLALTESREGAIEEVLGHVRILGVHPETEHRVYLESVIIKKSRRKEGFGRKLHEMVEGYAKDRLGARYVHANVMSEENERFYRRLQYDSYPTYAPQIAPNMLRTFTKARWDGIIIPDKWKHLYDDGEYLTAEEKAKMGLCRLVKDLDG